MFSEESLTTLGGCCPGIESIDFDYCSFLFKTLKLSKFPKLKKASILTAGEFGSLSSVDTTETNLENFYYESVDYNWVTSPAACCNIKELHLHHCHVIAPNLFEDFTTAFPLIENASIFESFKGVDWFKATTNSHLRSLQIHYNFLILQKLYIDCPNLKYFRFYGVVSEEVYINCPKLRSFQYSAHVNGNIPKVVSVNLPTDLWYRFDFYVDSDLDTSWFICLKKFIEQIGAHKSIWLSLRVGVKMVQFVLDEFEATPISKLNHVHLELEILNSNRKDIGHIAAFVDGLFWATYPNTLTIQGFYCFDAVKYLCGRLADTKPRNESCCELQLCNKYWWHNMEDFEVTQGNEDMTENLASLVEMVKFVLDEFEATPISQLKHVHLELDIANDKMADKGHLAAFLDGLFWATYPNTLTLRSYYCYNVLKYLCGKLADTKPRNESCCELQFCNKYWWHNIEDFEVTLGNKDMKEKLTCLAEQPNHQKSNPEFRFLWCTIEGAIARFLVEMH
uniref:Uncharacterized protein n=1 Tax=Chenopodium quinoa TaxID=63459 RepID=A0A803LNJ6_CHEQI